MSPHTNDPADGPPVTPNETDVRPEPPMSGDALDRYLLGVSKDDELERLQAFLHPPARQGALAQLRHWIAGGYAPPPPDLEGATAELRQRIDADGVPASPRASHHALTNRHGVVAKTELPRAGGASSLSLRHHMSSRWVHYLGTAASAVILGFVGWTMWHTRSVVIPTATQTYATHAGQRATVPLGGGDTIYLGPATTVSVLRDAAGRQTTATVNGQALFAVAHRRENVFQVRTGTAVVRVLGTTFLVRRYTAEHETRVVVVDGRVSLSPLGGHEERGQHVVLDAGMLGVTPDSGLVNVTPHIEVDEYTGWVRGQLVFRETPVRDIATEVARAYNVDIQVADSALGRRALTLTIPVAHLSLAGVLDAVSTALNAHVIRSGDHLTIAPGPAVSHLPKMPRHVITSESTYGR